MGRNQTPHHPWRPQAPETGASPHPASLPSKPPGPSPSSPAQKAAWLLSPILPESGFSPALGLGSCLLCAFKPTAPWSSMTYSCLPPEPQLSFPAHTPCTTETSPLAGSHTTFRMASAPRPVSAPPQALLTCTPFLLVLQGLPRSASSEAEVRSWQACLGSNAGHAHDRLWYEQASLLVAMNALCSPGLRRSRRRAGLW